MQETRRAVLSALSEGPVSGPSLADRLGVSRAAIWKHVDSLREDGFTIESTDAGYVLVDVPVYGGMAVEYGLDAPFTLEFHETLDSTNRRAKELAAEGERDIVVLAGEQTRGRGRLDRSWTSPSGGVYLSIVLRPTLPPAHVPILTLAAAVATARTARETGVNAGIKWPNDVLVSRDSGRARKLAGILTEMEGEADRVSWVVVGIGLNADIPAETLVEGATSLTAEGASIERRTVVQRLLEQFDALRTDPDRVLPAWRDLSLTLGTDVRVETPTSEVVGEAVEVSFPGTLHVDDGDGTVGVTAGDCEHLRPAE